MKKTLLITLLFPVMAFAQAVLPTSWGFTTPGVSTPPTGWQYNVGTNGNLTYAFGKGDALSARLDATGENITINFSEKPGVLTYYISPQNAGKPWTGQFDVQESDDGLNWTTIHSYTSTTTSATNFNNPMITDTLKSSTRWVRFYYTNKLKGDATGGGNIAIDLITVNSAPAPTVGTPLIKNGTNTILDNSTFLFGNSSSKSFTIENIGTVDTLKIDSIIISGQHAGKFSIGNFAQAIAATASDTFSVHFAPTDSGSHFATVSVYNNSPENNPYRINLYAIGGLYATSPAQVASISVSNVKTHKLQIDYSKANTESYLVLRKAGNAITDMPANGVTYKKGDYIGTSQVAYVGSDTASIRPTYIMANTQYTFTVFAFNGYAGYENYNTVNAPSATVTTLNGQVGNYYAGIDTLNSNFVTQLHNKIINHDTVFYSNYLSVMVNNYLTRDTSGGKKVVNCVYTDSAFVYDEPFTWWTGTVGSKGQLTREHTFAQSWMPSNTGGNWPNASNGKEFPEYNDMHNLFPANQIIANAKRSNYPFGEVQQVTYVSPTGKGKLGLDAEGKTVYEPRDDQKGDLARALFYMLVCYDGVNGKQWRLPSTQEVNVLLKWHFQDPPGALEIARNEHVFDYQKNRNPFIDHPEWVKRINFKNMNYRADSSNGVISVQYPAENSVVVAGKNNTIAWIAYNMDSVLVELKTSTSASFKSLGKYPANIAFVEYNFEDAAADSAIIRISKLSDVGINSHSGIFKIVNSSIQLNKPSANQQYTSNENIVVSWAKQYTDTVNLICYSVDRKDTLFLDNITADSAIITLAPKSGDYVVYIKEKSANKNAAYLASDSVLFSVQLANGIKENINLNNLVSVYPVPSAGTITVEKQDGLKITAIEVCDMIGRLIMNTTDLTFTLTQKGVYLIRIITSDGVVTKRVLIE